MPMGALGTGVNARVIPPRLAGVDRDHLGDTPGLGRHGAGKVPRGRQHRDFLRRQPGDLIHLESHQRLLEVRLDGVLMRRLLESFLVLLQDFAELGTQRRIVRRQGAQRPTELPDYSAGSPAASAAASRRGRRLGSASRHKRLPKDGGLRRCLIGAGHRRRHRGCVGLLGARLGLRSHRASEAKCRQNCNYTGGLHKTLFDLKIRIGKWGKSKTVTPKS
jgi:hypothetical protein